MSTVKQGKKKKRTWIAAGSLVLAAMIGASLLLPGKDADAAQEEKTTTAEAVKMNIEHTLTAEGEVTSSLEEKLSPHTSYYLEEIKVEAGDALEEGDTILTYTNGSTMTAPYACVVESWSLPEEEEQLTTDHYIKIAGTDVLQMQLDVDEDEVALLTTGDEGTVQIEATGSRCQGVVTSLSEVGEYSSSGSTFTAKLTFDNDGSIKLGMTGNASITLEKAEDAICVPLAAVHSRGKESFVTIESEQDKQRGKKHIHRQFPAFFFKDLPAEKCIQHICDGQKYHREHHMSHTHGNRPGYH